MSQTPSYIIQETLQLKVSCQVDYSRAAAHIKRSESMEMWTWRRIEKISWVDKIVISKLYKK